MLTSEVPDPRTVLSEISTPTSSVVPVPARLSPQEIERICRCFIRLITAKEEDYDQQQHTQ